MKRSFKKSALFFIIVLVLAFSAVRVTPAHGGGGLRHAKPSATGTGDCFSWANACTLQTALIGAVSGNEIWVMAGTHKPTTGSNREATFQLKNGVAVYGGFNGTETLLSQRDPAINLTTLSGNIGAAGNSDNSYHVVTGATGATLDGFTITAGNANGADPNNYGGGMYNNSSNPTLRNLIFSGNSATGSGGGIFNSLNSPTVTNVTFSGNSALRGGGMYNGSSSPVLTNVTFTGNLGYYGGGMHNWSSSSPTLTNVTFSGNQVDYGGMYNGLSSNPTINNAIFWGHTDWDGPQIFNNSSTPILYDSVVQGGCPDGSTCTRIISADPMLGALGNYGGFTQTIPLLAGSSAIDTGNDTTCADTDQRGRTRPQGAQCDIGAYEADASLTLRSVGDYDGWILESGENTTAGGTKDNTATTFYLGDGVQDKQYRAILHFDTSGLPENAVITKVTLKIKKQGLSGTNPFTILDGLKVDMRKPYFGTAAGLVIGDFEAAAGKTAVATFNATPVNNWYKAVLNATGRAYVNKTGNTQFRLRFATGDNDDMGADYMKFFSGDYATASARPMLVIEYYLPIP